MTVPTYVPYEPDLSGGYTVQNTDWNGMFDGIAGYLNGTIVPALNSIAGGTGVPSGCILLWSGSAGSVPVGWSICDGTNGTPNLQGMFVVGAYGGSNPVNAGGIGSPAIGTTGGATTHSHGGSTSISTSGIAFRSYTTGSVFYLAVNGTYGGSLSIASAGNVPPYYALCYIMKN